MGDKLPQMFIALVHFPVYNKTREIVTSSLTTINLHDLSRIATTYGTLGCYVVTPLRRQQEVARQMITHWTQGYGAAYNPTRAEALQHLCIMGTLEQVQQDILRRCGKSAHLIATDARRFPGSVSYAGLRRMLWQEDDVFLLLLGTAWGLTEELIGNCQYILAPITGFTAYNHLPVRVAAGILLDRLLGETTA